LLRLGRGEDEACSVADGWRAQLGRFLVSGGEASRARCSSVKLKPGCPQSRLSDLLRALLNQKAFLTPTKLH
jgi:hypothetical protein